MQTRSKTRKRGRVQHCYLDAKNKPIAIEPGVQFINEETSNGWADLPILVLEKIIVLDKGEQKYVTSEANYLQKLKKYADVCTQWRNGIMLSRKLLDHCTDYEIYLCTKRDRSFVESGFLSALKKITIGVILGEPEKMDHLSFVRSHVKNNFTSLTTFTIKMSDKTNIQALVELLAMSPNASNFTLMFHRSTLGVQQRAEQYWKVILTVFYCNGNEKNVAIYHNDRCEPTSPDWSFVNKSKFKRYKISRAPGVIKSLVITNWASYGWFLTAPDWNQPSISFDRVTVESASSEFNINYVSSIRAKTIQLQLAHGRRGLKQAEWANFTSCQKLEVRLSIINYDKREEIIDMMKMIKHPNFHVLIDEPIRVTDAIPPKKMDRFWSDYWKKADVDNFVNSIALSSTKTLTYTLKKFSRNPETITFECDEWFSTKFIAFLDTQPIYIGKDHEDFIFGKNFVTLEAAKQSFLQ